MLDASGRTPQALFQGNRYDLGTYDQCVNMQEMVENETIKGRYCTAGLILSLPESTNPGLLSVCLPNACYPSDFFGNSGSDQLCQTRNQSRSLDPEDIVFLSV